MDPYTQVFRIYMDCAKLINTNLMQILDYVYVDGNFLIIIYEFNEHFDLKSTFLCPPYLKLLFYLKYVGLRDGAMSLMLIRLY